MTSPRRALVHVVAPLALGVLAYFALRAPEIRLFDWAHSLGLDAAIAFWRAVTAPLKARVPSCVAGSLPDFAWAYAFGSALALVWANRRSRSAWVWWVLGFSITLWLELGQALGLIEGVFDWGDLIAMAGGYWLGVSAVCARSVALGSLPAPKCYAVHDRAW